jgi:hypothetical protein
MPNEWGEGAMNVRLYTDPKQLNKNIISIAVTRSGGGKTAFRGALYGKEPVRWNRDHCTRETVAEDFCRSHINGERVKSCFSQPDGEGLERGSISAPSDSIGGVRVTVSWKTQTARGVLSGPTRHVHDRH